MPLNRPSASHLATVVGEAAQFDVAVATSAALPWRTGPAFLSLWHACGLAEQGLRVAYLIPWLSARCQRRLWGSVRFSGPDQQSLWLAEEAQRIGCPPLPTVFYYPGRYVASMRSIVPLRDVFSALPSSHTVVLEEPEHLCWYPWTRTRDRVSAERVIGLVLTNYGYYVGRKLGSGFARLANRYHAWLMRRHTDLLVPLSPAVDLSNIDHPRRSARISGVLEHYARVPPVTAENRGVYFLGRLVWDKGLDMVIEMSRRLNLPTDVYGDGPDATAIARRARDREAPLRFFGASAEPWSMLGNYRVFFNPSHSEVLCTATADALVAGRHVVLPDCPANRPFLDYPNVHAYRDADGAAAALQTALKLLPQPPLQARHDFNWRTACQRLSELWATPSS